MKNPCMPRRKAVTGGRPSRWIRLYPVGTGQPHLRRLKSENHLEHQSLGLGCQSFTIGKRSLRINLNLFGRETEGDFVAEQSVTFWDGSNICQKITVNKKESEVKPTDSQILP
jgi:hypothetical protein